MLWSNIIISPSIGLDVWYDENVKDQLLINDKEFQEENSGCSLIKIIPSSIGLVPLQPCQNGVLGVVFWVWGIARSHTELNQVNMVVVERYALSFWRNGHEERVQCETAHYRDAKTTSCLPKISFETVLSDPLEMSIVSARSVIVNRRFLCTNSLIWLTCCSSVDVDGRPGRFKSSTRSLLSLKSLYYL